MTAIFIAALTPPVGDPRAACRGADPDLFVNDYEPPFPPAEAAEFCASCPIMPECLSWALRVGEVGIWGGTTTYQRRQLMRHRERTRCPRCAETALVTGELAQVCLACGLSWEVRGDVSGEAIAEAAR